MVEEQNTVTRRRRNRLRALRRIYLTVGAVTISVCAAGGAASATPTSDAAASDPGFTPYIYTVRLENETDQPLTGEWHLQVGDRADNIDFNTPLVPHEIRARGVNVDVPSIFSQYVWGRVCYNRSWWNLPRDSWVFKTMPWDETTTMTLKTINTPAGKKLEVLASADQHSGRHTLPMIETEHGTAC
ncbi:hypothetical protein R3Q06_36380 [Rhodococcus erythropolis]|uniref:hypothetical protein n=1 Tax=Rhodococcus erythropolis TaxID=1833 RepID=UPI002948F980|nr:hypothetical protein [Rhodococcus erythropolis]MDV6278841.1 hypothetical protein [Rhodococcus erythropolis]